jgi:hypothetical protein
MLRFFVKQQSPQTICSKVVQGFFPSLACQGEDHLYLKLYSQPIAIDIVFFQYVKKSGQAAKKHPILLRYDISAERMDNYYG